MGIQFDVVHYSFPDILTELRDMENESGIQSSIE